MDSKDDRKEVQHNLSKRQVMKQNKTDFKRFVGYYRHNENKQIDVKTDPNERGDAGNPDGEKIKNITEKAKEK